MTLTRVATVALVGVLVATHAHALTTAPSTDATLSPAQSRVFRAWMARVIDAQIGHGPTPRWSHRDCAGLVRFAVAEALRPHDETWRRSSGLTAPMPPELTLEPEQRALRNNWKLASGERSAYVGALELVQENATFVSRDLNRAEPGDLLFFDQGDDQHLMVFTGRYVAYHTGQHEGDGLRAVSIPQLLSWRDTRWQPAPDNPNFKGIFRLRFLAR